MKKGIKKLIILFFLLVFVGNLSACRWGLYMDDFINVRWTCSEINLQFTYTADDLEKATGTLIKDNKTILEIAFENNFFLSIKELLTVKNIDVSMIKDEFIELVNDDTLMTNHEKGKKKTNIFNCKR